MPDPLDRAGDELREVGNERGVRDEIADRFVDAAIDVEDV